MVDTAALVEALEKDYDYESVQTCAADGMCQTACPVDINTGDLVKRELVKWKDVVQRAKLTAD